MSLTAEKRKDTFWSSAVWRVDWLIQDDEAVPEWLSCSDLPPCIWSVVEWWSFSWCLASRMKESCPSGYRAMSSSWMKTSLSDYIIWASYKKEWGIILNWPTSLYWVRLWNRIMNSLKLCRLNLHMWLSCSVIKVTTTFKEKWLKNCTLQFTRKTHPI